MSTVPDKALNILWKQVVEEIQPKSTRALARQFYKLVNFDLSDREAIIEVKSRTWFALNKKYKPNIQCAFQLICKIDIEVKFSLEGEEYQKEPQKLLSLLEIERSLALERPVRQEVLADAISLPFNTESVKEQTSDYNNQGLGAPYQWNGLNFRSKSEVKIAQALDEKGILYFPNARGRLTIDYGRVNREVDFLVCYEGKWGILECDGEPYHSNAASDHARDMLWNQNGIWFIKRFSSTECYNDPTKVVTMFLQLLKLFNSQKNTG